MKNILYMYSSKQMSHHSNASFIELSKKKATSNKYTSQIPSLITSRETAQIVQLHQKRPPPLVFCLFCVVSFWWFNMDGKMTRYKFIQLTIIVGDAYKAQIHRIYSAYCNCKEKKHQKYNV